MTDFYEPDMPLSINWSVKLLSKAQTSISGWDLFLLHILEDSRKQIYCSRARITSCWYLRCRTTKHEVVPKSREPIVAAASVWNNLRDDFTSASSLPPLKNTFVVPRCYNTVWFCLFVTLTLQWSSRWRCCLGHFKNTCDDDDDDSTALISVYVALSQSPAYTARPRIRASASCGVRGYAPPFAGTKLCC